jgi:hypothetical protein
MEGPINLTALVQGAIAQAQAAQARALERQAHAPAQELPAVSPLVETDRLYFVVVPTDHVGAKAQTALREAFKATWSAIPQADRRRLLDYWRKPPNPHFCREYSLLLAYKPVIWLGELPYTAVPNFQHYGRVLVIPAWIAAEEPERLPAELARLLASVHLIADGTQWKLESEMVEEPFEAWERAHGDRATEAQWDAQNDRLFAAYSHKMETEVARVLHGWGLDGKSDRRRPRGAGPRKAPAARRRGKSS